MPRKTPRSTTVARSLAHLGVTLRRDGETAHWLLVGNLGDGRYHAFRKTLDDVAAEIPAIAQAQFAEAVNNGLPLRKLLSVSERGRRAAAVLEAAGIGAPAADAA